MHPKDASSEAVWSWSALLAETYLSQYIEFVRYIYLAEKFDAGVNNFREASFCSYARPAQLCPIRWLGPLKSAESRSRI